MYKYYLIFCGKQKLLSVTLLNENPDSWNNQVSNQTNSKKNYPSNQKNFLTMFFLCVIPGCLVEGGAGNFDRIILQNILKDAETGKSIEIIYIDGS